ncbi:hypothetical protein ACI2OX_15940 [Bacillus sp. N9]
MIATKVYKSVIKEYNQTIEQMEVEDITAEKRRLKNIMKSLANQI